MPIRESVFLFFDNWQLRLIYFYDAAVKSVMGIGSEEEIAFIVRAKSPDIAFFNIVLAPKTKKVLVWVNIKARIIFRCHLNPFNKTVSCRQPPLTMAKLLPSGAALNEMISSFPKSAIFCGTPPFRG